MSMQPEQANRNFDDPRAQAGEWQVLPYDSQIEAVHMAALHTGKVLYYSGFRVAEAVPTETRLWYPKTGEIKTVPTPGDLFCAGHSFLPDGRLLSTGGSLEYRGLPKFPPWLVKLTRPIQPLLVSIGERIGAAKLGPTGSTFLYLFDPSTEQWSFAGDMPEGRWYPTNTSLPNGKTLILSGLNEGGGFGTGGKIEINRRVEIFDAEDGIRQMATIPVFTDEKQGNGSEKDKFPSEEGFPSDYPRMYILPVPEEEKHLYPAGKAFCAGEHPDTKMLNLQTWEWTDIASLNCHGRQDGCFVLLPLRPPHYHSRVLAFGGSSEGGGAGEVTDTAEIIDLCSESPHWEWAEPLKDRRVNSSAVLLPDGKLLAMSGNSTSRFDQPVLHVELYDPDTGAWQMVAPMSVPRGYHSTAILLPDGRVLSSGTTPFGFWELRMEVYWPYYLFRGARPVIQQAPKSIVYGQSFEVEYQCPEGEIRTAVLMRPGAMTHAFDMEQRHIELTIQAFAPGRLTAIAPRDEYVAPPGYYMLFLLNDNGVPSEAKFVHLPVRKQVEGQ